MERIFTRTIIVSLTLWCLVCQTAVCASKIKKIAKDPYISAVVIDADTGTVIFQDNPDKPAYPASMVKLMDMLIILEKVGQGQAKVTDTVKVPREAMQFGGSQVWLDEKESFTLDDMLYALMISSANDVAVALAVHFAGSHEAFVGLMNEKAKALGMNSTRFTSAHGLPDKEGKRYPDVSSAMDMALLSRELLKHPDILRYTSTKQRLFRPGAPKGKEINMLNHNGLLGRVEGCDGLKTGWFDAGGYSISATAMRNNRRVIAVVMGSATSRGKVRDAKASELIAQAFMNLPPLTPPEPVVKVDPEAQALVEEQEKGISVYCVFAIIAGTIVVTAIAGIGVFLFLRRRNGGGGYDGSIHLTKVD